MRTSVRVKNFIAKLIIVIAVLVFIGMGSVTEEITFKKFLIAMVSVVIGKLGYKLLEW